MCFKRKAPEHAAPPPGESDLDGCDLLLKHLKNDHVRLKCNVFVEPTVGKSRLARGFCRQCCSGSKFFFVNVALARERGTSKSRFCYRTPVKPILLPIHARDWLLRRSRAALQPPALWPLDWPRRDSRSDYNFKIIIFKIQIHNFQKSIYIYIYLIFYFILFYFS